MGWLGALLRFLKGREVFQTVKLKELLAERCCYGLEVQATIA